MGQTPKAVGMAATATWRALRHPLLVLIMVMLAAILVAAGSLLAQLPGQLRDEPTTASRWLLNASSAHGMWGNLWLGLGLFDILHSPLTALLGILLALALSAHLAAQIASIVQMRSAQRAMTHAVAQIGTPVSIANGPRLVRSRFAVTALPAEVGDLVQIHLAQRFGTIEQSVGEILDTESFDKSQGGSDATSPDGADNESPACDQRFLALTGQNLLWLRLLLPIGLMLALGAVWVAVAFGWHVTTPPLAPNDTFRAVNQNLELVYQVPAAGQGDTAATLIVRNGTGSEAFSVLRAQRIRVGSTLVNIQPQYPGVLVQMEDGAAKLARPGGTERISQVGVVIPTRGSEESVLLPDYGAGLRIVQRGTEDDAMLLELYRSNAVEPVFRAELTRSGRVTIPLDDTQTAIVVNNMPGLQVDVSYQPGLWLAWVGLGLALVGLLGALRRVGFVVVQLAPWPTQRTLAVIQSNLPREQARLMARLAPLTGERY